MGNQQANRRSTRDENDVGTPVDAPDGRVVAVSASSATQASGGRVVSTEEAYRYRESRTESGSVVQRSYSFTVRERCLSGPPPNFRQRRRSLYSYLGVRLGGNFAYEPEHMITGEDHPVCSLSQQTVKVLKKVFEDVDPADIVDYHVHLVGHGDSGSGCSMHYSVKQWWRPFTYLKTHVFMSAAQVPDLDGGDIQYISRLIRLAKHFVPSYVFDPSQHGYKHGKYCLLPFDEFYHKNGQVDPTKTTLFVPNDYSFSLSSEFPDMFLPFGSVNPYRPDALEELERCAQNGVTVIKWLPNSMGINPSDKECEPFYDKMKELDMALLIHVGEEHTVTAAFIDNRLGNPLFMRKPLDRGVKVIAAHCATEGYAVDFERNNETVPCFELFMRLMDDAKYKELLFGDISAVCGFKRVGYLQRLLQATHVHDRLVFGSDYPVPAINLVVHTSKLQRCGMITPEECTVLNELYNYNPLLFDFVCKRLLKGPKGETFPPALFKAHPLLPPCRKPSSNEVHVQSSDKVPTDSPEKTNVSEQLQDGAIKANIERESSVDVADTPI